MSAAVMKKSEKADASRQRILNAAARLFRSKGYAAVSLREIAGQAGMKAGSLYYHFDSKEQIVGAILDAGIQAVHAEVEAAIEALPETASPQQVIHQGILSHLRSLFEYSHFTSANVRIYGQVPPAVRKANLKVRRAYESFWEELLQAIADRGVFRPDIDLRRLRLLLISSMNATLEWFDPKRESLGELADSYTSMVLHGVLAEPKP